MMRPIVISLYSGEDYYRTGAALLREDCTRLGIDHDIVEIEKSDAEGWIDVCRFKVPFFLDMQRKHGRPIVWLDVDSRLAAWPTLFDGLTCDIAGFLRGFGYLRDFDPLAAPRFFASFALYFNATPAATAFLELMARLESEFDRPATDDFFLHEAWTQHREQLSVMILPPDLVGHEWPLLDPHVIHKGISGNVPAFRSQAEQHVAPLLAPARRKAVLLHEAAAARRSGRLDDALLLYRLALEAAPPDDALAEKIARMMRHQGMRGEAERFLRDYRGRTRPLEAPDDTPHRTRWLSRH